MLSFVAFGSTAQNSISDVDLFKTITTAVPFLQIAPDARSAGLGDAGVAISPDANSVYWNGAKTVFAKESGAFAMSYTPWLQALNIQDMDLLFLSGFVKLDDQQAVNGSLRYFSLGEIVFKENATDPGRTVKPFEMAITGGYSRKLSDKFSGGLNGRFIYSDISPGYFSPTVGQTEPGVSFAADLSAYYVNDAITLGETAAELAIGMNISNIGAKISYSQSAAKDFLPTNLKLGAALKMELDEYNELTFLFDVNKLLVPSVYDSTGEKGVVTGIFQSFNDAPGGFQEELQEITIAPGIEYWYDNQFAIRAGYFYGSAVKGYGTHFTLGAGLKYNVFNLDFAYLIPITNNNPLRNTLRFTLSFDFDKIKAQGNGN
jgi:hypothetical protein